MHTDHGISCRARVVLVVAAGVALLTPASAAGAEPCAYQPQPGLSQTSAMTPAGIREETTTYEGGRRAVTRCRSDGTLVDSTTTARLIAATGELREEVLSRVEPADRGGLAITWYTYASPRPDGAAAALASSAIGPDDSCSNSEFVRLKSGGKTIIGWPARKYTYLSRTSSMPHGDADRLAITRGHLAWDFTVNDCGFGDKTDFTTSYGGTTTTTAHTKADGKNVIDFGSLSPFGSSNNAIATAKIFLDSSRRLKECDERFELPIAFDGGSATWSVSDNPNANQLDVWSVAAHESGHCLGLDHATSSRYWLTMASNIINGTTHQRNLGRGDVLGVRAIYP